MRVLPDLLPFHGFKYRTYSSYMTYLAMLQCAGTAHARRSEQASFSG
jgi:hypothetical protein